MSYTPQQRLSDTRAAMRRTFLCFFCGAEHADNTPETRYELWRSHESACLAYLSAVSQAAKPERRNTDDKHHPERNTQTQTMPRRMGKTAQTSR